MSAGIRLIGKVYLDWPVVGCGLVLLDTYLCSKKAIYPAKSQSSSRHHSVFSPNLQSKSRAFDFGVSRHLSNHFCAPWRTRRTKRTMVGGTRTGLATTPRAMTRAATWRCWKRPATTAVRCGTGRRLPRLWQRGASTAGRAVQPSRPRRACTWPLGGYATWRTVFWARR